MVWPAVRDLQVRLRSPALVPAPSVVQGVCCTDGSARTQLILASRRQRGLLFGMTQPVGIAPPVVFLAAKLSGVLS